MCLCASFLVRIAGAGAAPSPLLPAPAFTFLTGSPCYILTISLFFHKHHPFLGLISTLLMSIETCAYVLLSWYALRGRALRPPPCTPPTRFYFFNRLPSVPTILLLFHKHHPFLGLISTLLMSIETCAYVLLSWYALRGRALRPPPCTPPPAFIFLTGSHLYLLFFCFFISIILSLGSFQLY